MSTKILKTNKSNISTNKVFKVPQITNVNQTSPKKIIEDRIQD